MIAGEIVSIVILGHLLKGETTGFNDILNAPYERRRVAGDSKDLGPSKWKKSVAISLDRQVLVTVIINECAIH